MILGEHYIFKRETTFAKEVMHIRIFETLNLDPGHYLTFIISADYIYSTIATITEIWRPPYAK